MITVTKNDDQSGFVVTSDPGETMRHAVGHANWYVMTVAIGLIVTSVTPADAQAPRERVRIDRDWRFQRGDPAGNSVDLRYDVRPAVERSADGKVADAEPEAAASVASGDARVLKPWILPSANAFIADPAKRHIRPAGDPGAARAGDREGRLLHG